jgi:hypothetical protein
VPKVHNKPIKKPKKDSNIESKSQPKCALVWRTGLYGAPPDSVWCTRDSNSELLTFGNSGGRSAIIHRTVRWSTGLSGGAPDCPVEHRTVRCTSGATTTSRQWSSAEGIKCAPESEQRQMAHRTVNSACPVAQKTEAPTVRIQRLGDVAGAPDSVRWRIGLSGAPYDSSLHQTASLVVGVINTPNHPPFIASKFSPTPYKSYSIQYKTHKKDQILSQVHRSFPIK